eukprot:191769-Prymnesium_polylepis.1
MSEEGTQVQISQRDAFAPSRCRAAPRGATAPLQRPSSASLAATRGAGARSSGRMRGVNTGCEQRVVSGNQSLGPISTQVYATQQSAGSAGRKCTVIQRDSKMEVADVAGGDDDVAGTAAPQARLAGPGRMEHA